MYNCSSRRDLARGTSYLFSVTASGNKNRKKGFACIEKSVALREF